VQRLPFRLGVLLSFGMLRCSMYRWAVVADLRLQSGRQVKGSEDKEEKWSVR